MVSAMKKGLECVVDVVQSLLGVSHVFFECSHVLVEVSLVAFHVFPKVEDLHIEVISLALEAPFISCYMVIHDLADGDEVSVSIRHVAQR